MLYYILMFVVVFIGAYLVYYFIFDDMLKKEKYTKISELGLLTRVFKLDKKKMNYRQCLNGVAIINAFIISFTFTVIQFLKIPIVFMLIIAFIIMLILVFVCYMLYGKYCHKKWGKKDGV